MLSKEPKVCHIAHYSLQELLAVGQPLASLNLLHEAITSRRNRSAPVSVLEPIMIKFLQLTVSLQKGKLAREGLHQYKNMTQNVSVSTLQIVIKSLIQEAEQKVQEAAQAEKVSLETVEDLEAIETPESIMLSAVSGSDYKQRTEKQVLTPWVKFLWEAYRIALDTLRNNARLEILYQVCDVHIPSH
jgi:translation initiation factor 3 subunit A